MSKCILYIDDDEKNRALVNRLLTVSGYEVIEADNGLEGIDKAMESLPDLILIDINMPGLDGFETTTRLKGIEELKKVSVIALTARDAEDKDQALVAGCDGYISKPINVDSFVETVKKFIEGKKEKIDALKEKDLLRDYSQYLVRSLDNKVRQLETVNEELESRVGERTMALEEAQQRRIALEKKKTLLELAGGIAHELNQPLTVILSLSELLLSSPELEDENSTLVRQIREECNRVAGIVSQIGSINQYEIKKYYENVNIIDLDKSSS